MPFGDVANADDVAVAPIELGLADRDLHRDAIAALGAAPGLVRRQIHVRIVDLGGEALEKIAGSPLAMSGSRNPSERPRISAGA